jgi:hypothetical protein
VGNAENEEEKKKKKKKKKKQKEGKKSPLKYMYVYSCKKKPGEKYGKIIVYRYIL